MGDRSDALASAVSSLRDSSVIVVANGADGSSLDVADHVTVVTAPTNLGVPGGRDLGVRSSSADVVGFLDDDAIASSGVSARIIEAFAADDRLGAVALRLVDEEGHTARRHVPRIGASGATDSGDVATFLGGACAIRRAAYLEAGGYWAELFYGHEELELSWRLVDSGWRIRYLSDVSVVHPRTDIGRHREGWRLTGRNRVMVARRTLPRAIGLLHVAIWLVIGVVRAPGRRSRTAYLSGWWNGWRVPIDRSPVTWRTVVALSKLGRPPII